MNDIKQALKSILQKTTGGDCLDAIASCHKLLKQRYPNQRFRWCEIHGPRWAHIYGEADEHCCDLIRVPLNDGIGLCIENTTAMPPAELKKLIDGLKNA
jgi:hypothetical protein